jgi:AcrR family transcriptional regulator
MPRQIRALRTHKALLAAVERLVAEEGADAVTTTRIAGETGVSVGTIYRYFADRDALLLAAYDASVQRIVTACAEALPPADAAPDAAEAARTMLGAYLEAAEAIPAHSGLLRAMRAIRRVEADQDTDRTGVDDQILAPFLTRFKPGAALDPMRLKLLNLLLGTLVDLYLITEDPAERNRVHDEIEAHMLLALERMGT